MNEREGGMPGIGELLIAELETPTGMKGPLDAAYMRAAGGVWHSVLGAVACALFAGFWGLALAFPLAVIYWLVKERQDLRRGGDFWDGIEDAMMVAFGAWYGVWWWPIVLCAAGLVILISAGWRARL